MLFSEIYGSYFNVVAAVLSEASDGKLTDRRMTELVREKAFAESALAIPAALKSGTWPLLDQEYHSILHHKPTMPLTMLQKRWLKALLSDPRIALFDPDTTGLEDVDPLYAQDTFILFDQYADGDPYGDPAYIACFQTALKAIRKKRKLRIRFRGHTGARHSIECIPYRLEYSAKDDKFRLLATGKRRLNTINMARVRSCELLDAYDPKSITLPQENSEELVMLLHDERNGLERVLLHFSHFEKETQKLADRLYQIRLRYDKDDETELLIRVLSFGPVLEVISSTAPPCSTRSVRVWSGTAASGRRTSPDGSGSSDACRAGAKRHARRKRRAISNRLMRRAFFMLKLLLNRVKVTCSAFSSMYSSVPQSTLHDWAISFWQIFAKPMQFAKWYVFLLIQT